MSLGDANGAGPSAPPTLDELAAAVGATDLFLFRRIDSGRFAHIGGVGRGGGWAGIVEVGVADEPLVAEAFGTGAVVRRCEDERWHVFGPYYGVAAAVVPVDADVFAVFGAPDSCSLISDDAELRKIAFVAGESISEVAAAKRLADELEVVNAVRDLLRAPGGSFGEAMHSVVEHAAKALSCEVGALYVRDRGQVAVFDPSGLLPAEPGAVGAAMEEIARLGNFPVCIQEAAARELPSPFATTDGVVSYYLLGFEAPLAAVLLIAHTTAAPRGFTQLCQTLGLRLVEAAGPVLATALSADELREDLERAAGQARRDPLTGVANRRAWIEAAAACTGSRRPVSVVQLDCRGLKQMNDVHGHHVGDRLLRLVARIVQSSVREGDVVARLGGDEFAVLLDDADEAVASTIIERIKAEVAAAPPIESVPVALSIGTATTRSGDVAAAQRHADALMLADKRAA
jgi:diguanylate cyclase (GGDEF)-like protein